MSNEFLQPKNPRALEVALSTVQTASELRLAMLNALQREGTCIPMTEAEINPYRVQDEPSDARPAVPLSSFPALRNAYIRVIYPRGNDRFEIYGATEEEVNDKEARLRAIYGGNR